jgi:hypothetical protein
MRNLSIRTAKAKIQELTLQMLEQKSFDKIDLIQRKIDALKDFIYFKKDIKSY